MIGIYEFKKESLFRLKYREGELLIITVLTTDKITFDGLKHHIEFYEGDLNKELFKRVE